MNCWLRLFSLGIIQLLDKFHYEFHCFVTILGLEWYVFLVLKGYWQSAMMNFLIERWAVYCIYDRGEVCEWWAGSQHCGPNMRKWNWIERQFESIIGDELTSALRRFKWGNPVGTYEKWALPVDSCAPDAKWGIQIIELVGVWWKEFSLLFSEWDAGHYLHIPFAENSSNLEVCRRIQF